MRHLDFDDNLTLDVNGRLATRDPVKLAFQILAWLSWPDDPRRRAQYLAMIAAYHVMSRRRRIDRAARISSKPSMLPRTGMRALRCNVFGQPQT